MKEIYGFSNIKNEIIKNYKENSLHHCNLIYGQKGIGKASFAYNISAFILTQKVNEDITNIEVEKTHKLMESGGHTDFKILDLNTLDVNEKENTSKKGEINVNQVRKIIDDIRLTPSISKNKVLIIDSIDIVNINGQNALLKTLEEPPKNTYIFLICHNMNKVIRTIQSRSNIIGVGNLDIENWSKAFFSNEEMQSIELEDEDIEDLYNLSDYSVGNAMEIVKNNAIDFYDDILNLLLSNNILEIQKFAEKVNTAELFNLFSKFFDKIFQNLFESKYLIDESKFYERRKEKFQNILKQYSIEKLLEKYEKGRQIIDDISIYNLDKKHCIVVLFNNLNK